MNKREVYREVDLITLLRALWRRVWLIVLVTVVFGVVCFAWARFLITPTYQASALMYVNNTQDSGKPISNSELSAAQSLVDTYMVILSSRTTLDQVRTAANLTYTDKQLNKMISAQAVNGTEVFEITVTVRIRKRLEILPIPSRRCYRPVFPMWWRAARCRSWTLHSSQRRRQVPVFRAICFLACWPDSLSAVRFSSCGSCLTIRSAARSSCCRPILRSRCWLLFLSFCSRAAAMDMVMETGQCRRRAPSNDF